MLRRAVAIDDEDELPEEENLGWGERARDWVAERPRDAVAVLVAAVATGVIAVNALFLQTGPHPAPLFALRSGTSDRDALTLPRSRPMAAATARTDYRTPRTHAELVADIQRGLATRGYYDGAVDGIYGPRTDSAVRDFAQAAHLKVDTGPNETLLRSILTSAVKEIRPAPVASMSRAHRDPIADLIGPSSRILAVQRALSDFGYGQIKPTGVTGPDTAAAIEKFERSRNMPVTGQISERLMRELAAVTGRPLE